MKHLIYQLRKYDDNYVNTKLIKTFQTEQEAIKGRAPYLKTHPGLEWLDLCVESVEANYKIEVTIHNTNKTFTNKTLYSLTRNGGERMGLELVKPYVKLLKSKNMSRRILWGIQIIRITPIKVNKPKPKTTELELLEDMIDELSTAGVDVSYFPKRADKVLLKYSMLIKVI